MPRSFQWDDLLAEVSKGIPPQQFRAWIEPTKFIRVTERDLVIGAPTAFSRDWITDHYKNSFQAATGTLYGLHLNLVVEVLAEENATSSESSPGMSASRPQEDAFSRYEPSSPAQASAPNKKTPEPSAQQNLHLGLPQELDDFSPAPSAGLSSGGNQLSSEQNSPSSELAGVLPSEAPPMPPRPFFQGPHPAIRIFGQPFDPKQTFDTFVVGASNQFAHAAARAVAEHPASQYNPLFLYSDAGLGKTHLLHAIGNYVLKVNPKAKICYISAEKFVNDLIDSIHHGKMSQFRERYRDSYDILLMDDIQFIAGKDRTQEEFFHTFNALHSSRRQIVVTSDKFPKDIPGLEDRLRTRFEWGLVADIQPPEIETRIAILRAKAEMDDIFLPNDVALFLASNIKTNIRELEGCLIRLGAQASLTGSEISIDLAKSVLRNILKEPSSTITADAIQDAVTRHFSIKISDLKSKERSRRVSLPRQIAMYLIRKYCNKSFPDIGLLLGGKDHSTVVYGVQSIAAEIEKNAEIRRHVEEIQNSL